MSSFLGSGGRPDRHGATSTDPRAVRFRAALLTAFAFTALVVHARAQSLALPRPGDHTLRIISPTVLELEIVTRYGDEHAPFIDLVGEDNTAQLPEPAALSVEVDGAQVAVKSLGFKRRVLYAPLKRNDVRVGNWLYLKLAKPLPANARVSVAAREPSAALWPDSYRFTADFDPKRLSPAIHLNEVGYATSFPKVAFVGYYLGNAGEIVPPSDRFTLLDAHTHAVVFRGHLTPRPDRGNSVTRPPYQEVLQADFSDFHRIGTYLLSVEGLGVSRPFRIHEGAAMAFARTYALGLYHQRCGAPNELPFTRFTHGACHTAPSAVPDVAEKFAFTWKTIGEVAARKRGESGEVAHPFTADPASQLFPFVRRGEVDTSGGHHDAGDYSKYTANSAAFVHTLVFAVDSVQGIAALDNLGLPESGDGIPDLLQLAKWEADFLAKMQDEDGGFYFLVYPRERRYESDTLPDSGEPQVVWPKNTAVTAAAVAALAQASSSPAMQKHFPADAQRYREIALRGWTSLDKALEQHGGRDAYQRLTHYGDNFGHDDELAWAACELFLATGDDAFQRALFRAMPDPASNTTRRWGWSRLAESWGNAIRSYAFAARTGRLSATKLESNYLKLCEAELLSAGDDALKRSQMSAYGTAFPVETKRFRSGGWFFSLDAAMDLAVAWQLEHRADFFAALVGNMNFEGGANPVNRVYVTGLGAYRQRELVHQFAQNDQRVLPPSGIPIGNIQVGLPHHAKSDLALRTLSFPEDGAKEGPFAFYDRWSDVHNVSTEFIILNQARGLVSAAFLAAHTKAAAEPWRAVNAKIIGAEKEIAFGEERELRLDQVVTSTSLDLSGAEVIWEARAQEPRRGETFLFSPQRGGPQWVEAEALWADGRRVFARTELSIAKAVTHWVDDEWPTGARDHPKKPMWLKAETSAAFSGERAFTSPTSGPGLHEVGFDHATERLEIGVGDVLFVHVWLDPKVPPRGILVAWNDGDSWEHRAYWGVSPISYGKDGTSGRRSFGPLPELGRWVRLDVPAAALGLEGKRARGLSFAALDGRAVWDLAGVRDRTAPAPVPLAPSKEQ